MNMDKIFERIKRDIGRDGWSTIGVFPTVEDPGVTFSYSVGFQEHGQPEVIVLGLPPDLAHSMIHSIYDHVANGEELYDGMHLDDVIHDFDVILRALPSDGAPLNVARSYYKVNELPALQVLWPDEQGRYPGEEGCDERIVQEQDVEAIRRDDVQKLMQNSHVREDARAPVDERPFSGFAIQHIEGKITEGVQVLEMFKNWDNADQLNLERFWADFDIDAEAIRQFSMNCGMSLNTAPAIIGLMMTFGAAVAISRYNPKGQPEITI